MWELHSLFPAITTEITDVFTCHQTSLVAQKQMNSLTNSEPTSVRTAKCRGLRTRRYRAQSPHWWLAISVLSAPRRDCACFVHIYKLFLLFWRTFWPYVFPRNSLSMMCCWFFYVQSNNTEKLNNPNEWITNNTKDWDRKSVV